MINLTYEIARELLWYSPKTGLIFWRERSRKWFASDAACAVWNKRFAGRLAFVSTTSKGYKQGRVLYRLYLAHRVAWLMMTGAWPEDEVDHDNGDRTDNRFKNLFETTSAGNKKNAKLSCRNTSGAPGVSWDARRKRWHVRVGREHVGYFKELDAARKARTAAAHDAGYHKNHGRAA